MLTLSAMSWLGNSEGFETSNGHIKVAVKEVNYIGG
jgi:hypothetical protein